MSRSRVDLPQPLGPSRTVVRPWVGTNEVGASTAFAPKTFETFSSAITLEKPWFVIRDS